MDLGLASGLAGTILTLVSLVYAIYVTRKSKREKELLYDLLTPAPIADVVSTESGHSVRIIYEGPDFSVEVESVFIQYLRFTNFGRVPITRGDSAEGDPLRIEVLGGRVLDMAVASVTRDVCRIQLAYVRHGTTDAVARVGFDFLDFLDGGLVQIVTDDKNAIASLKGTVIGMPQGIRKSEAERHSIVFPDLGCVIPLLMQAATLASVPFLYRYFTGGWSYVWLLLLPLAALVLPLAVTLPLVVTLVNRGVARFPEHLRPPSWYHNRHAMYEGPRRPGDAA